MTSMLRGLTVGLGAVALPTLAVAHDALPEFGAFVRPAATSPRAAPPAAWEWERALRGPASFGPPPQRDAERRLLAAVRSGDWPEVQQMLKAGGVNVNARDEVGGGVLARAARAGQDAVVAALIARGAALDQVSDDGFTPLGAAAFAGHRSTLRLLLRAGADATAWGATGQPPLHLAAMNGRVEIIDELLRQGVEPALRNRQRETALDVAAERGQQDAMARLLDAGVDPSTAGR